MVDDLIYITDEDYWKKLTNYYDKNIFSVLD